MLFLTGVKFLLFFQMGYIYNLIGMSDESVILLYII